ncbi:MAG: MmgE/PrpD family protein [Burkholderiales bacterium]|nr:MmgE/PrpD family protein [Burkholderiales bacterium]
MKAETNASQHALRLLEFASTLAAEPLPKGIAARAKRCLLDNLGCGLFGASQPWSRIMLDEVLADASKGACTAFGCEQGLSPVLAALANGNAIHGFELDDLIPAALIHPGTVIVPAVLAAAEASGASGRRVLAGLVAGYEAAARISLALGVEPSQRGFHKTGVVGPVAGAIAAGVVTGLAIPQLQSAVGLACSMASGIKAFAGGGGGGMVKRLHAGRAAEAGVRAAQLARRGFTGPATALDGHLGLLEVFSGASAQREHLSQALSERWFIDDVWIKVYPLCGWIQGVAQLLLALRGPQPLSPAQVKKVTIGTSAFAVKHNGNRSPRDEMEAQYSIPYCAGLALTADPGDPKAFLLEALADPAAHALSERVELHVDAESEAVYPNRFGSRIRLELANGETRQAFTLDPHGTATDPLTDSEVAQKFLRLARLSPRAVDAAAIQRRVEDLDTLKNVHELTLLLRG